MREYRKHVLSFDTETFTQYTPIMGMMIMYHRFTTSPTLYAVSVNLSMHEGYHTEKKREKIKRHFSRERKKRDEQLFYSLVFIFP